MEPLETVGGYAADLTVNGGLTFPWIVKLTINSNCSFWVAVKVNTDPNQLCLEL